MYFRTRANATTFGSSALAVHSLRDPADTRALGSQRRVCNRPVDSWTSCAGTMASKRRKSRRDEDRSPEDAEGPESLGRAHRSSTQRGVVSRDTDVLH